MSPSIRVMYFLLLSLSLLSALFGVHELLQVPLGNIHGLIMVGIGMLILAWVIVYPLKPLNDRYDNSLQRRISIRFESLMPARLKQPLISIAIASVRLRVLPWQES